MPASSIFIEDYQNNYGYLCKIYKFSPGFVYRQDGTNELSFSFIFFGSIALFSASCQACSFFLLPCPFLFTLHVCIHIITLYQIIFKYKEDP